MNWYEVDNIENIDTPALLLYKARIRQNIDAAISLIKDSTRLRPHIKTNKIKEVCEMMMAAGVEKFKCATIAEAEMLGLIKAKDVLLAYQPVGPKANRFLDLVRHYPATRFSCLVDNEQTAKHIAGIFGEAGLTVTFWIDVNTGMNRTGIDPSKANDLLDALLGMPSAFVAGAHVYDGHITDTDIAVRENESDKGFAQLEPFLKYFAMKALRIPSVVAGGSPTFQSHIKRNVECSPGTFVFWDMGYSHLLPGEPFQSAALVITRVVSIVNNTHITTDLGYKSVASENPLPRVYFLNAPSVHPFFQNEEHLSLEVDDSRHYKPGDILYGMPEHICPTVALYDEAYIIENHQITDCWKIVARNRKINY